MAIALSPMARGIIPAPCPGRSAMTLKQLEALHAILKTGSITAAARSLHVTQPAISAALKYAEQDLQLKLFERIGGKLQPTPEALAMQPDLEEIFGRVDALHRAARDLRDGRAGQLVVATSPTLVDALLPRAIARFRQLSPAVKVIVHSLPTPLAVERVARREADIGIVYAPIADNGVDSEPLMHTEMACVVPAGHALAKKRQIGPADLTPFAVISLGATTRLGLLINEGCHKAGIAGPPIAIEASSSHAACLMVSAGTGIAVVDRLMSISQKFDDLKFIAFKPRIRVSLRLIFPRQRARSRATVQFTAQLRHSLGVS